MRNLLIILLLLSSCQNSNRCTPNKALSEDFEKAISYIISSEKVGSEFSPKVKVNTVFFMEQLTKEESTTFDYEFAVYPYKKGLKEDLNRWKNWYDTNKCMNYSRDDYNWDCTILDERKR